VLVPSAFLVASAFAAANAAYIALHLELPGFASTTKGFNASTLQRRTELPTSQLPSTVSLSESSHPRYHSARPTGHHCRDRAGNNKRRHRAV